MSTDSNKYDPMDASLGALELKTEGLRLIFTKCN